MRGIWTNAFYDLYKYILWFGQIHFVIWTNTMKIAGIRQGYAGDGSSPWWPLYTTLHCQWVLKIAQLTQYVHSCEQLPISGVFSVTVIFLRAWQTTKHGIGVIDKFYLVHIFGVPRFFAARGISRIYICDLIIRSFDSDLLANFVMFRFLAASVISGMHPILFQILSDTNHKGFRQRTDILKIWIIQISEYEWDCLHPKQLMV